MSPERTLEDVPTRVPASRRLRLPLPIPPRKDGPLVFPVRVVLRAQHADEPVTQEPRLPVARQAGAGGSAPLPLSAPKSIQTRPTLC